jgi:hypothetical protein
VPAQGHFTVHLELETKRLGRIQVPVLIRVQGSRNKALQLIADASSTGPTLEFLVGTPADLLPASASIVSSASSGLEQEPSKRSVGSVAASTTSGKSSKSAAAGKGAAAKADRLASATSKVSSSSKSAASAATAAAAAAALAAQAPSVSEVAGWQASATMDFGKVAVLQLHERVLTIHNPTLIAAQMKLFVESNDSSFEVRPTARLHALSWPVHSLG